MARKKKATGDTMPAPADPLDLDGSPLDDVEPSEAEEKPAKPTTQRWLDHVFTEDELFEMSQKRIEADEATDATEKKLGEVEDERKELKERLSVLLTDSRRLGRRIRAGHEFCQVPCFEQRAGGFVVTLRADTGEEVERRPLKPEERQAALFPS